MSIFDDVYNNTLGSFIDGFWGRGDDTYNNKRWIVYVAAAGGASLVLFAVARKLF